MLKLTLIVAITFCLAAPLVAAKKLYKCEGDHGETSFQDQPCRSIARTKELVASEPASPRPAFDGTPVTFNFQQIPLATVISILAEEGGVELHLAPQANRHIDIRVVREPWDAVLDSLIRRHRLHFEVIDGVGYIR
jgi:hypothetical protein